MENDSRSIVNFASNIDRHLHNIEKNISIEENKTTLKQYFSHIRDKGIANATIRKNLGQAYCFAIYLETIKKTFKQVDKKDERKEEGEEEIW